MKKFAIAALALLAACTDVPNATRVLREAGYTDITTTGYRAWMCSKDDNYSTGFRATGPTGHRVSGAVCRGVFKGSTIRLD